MSFFAGVVWDRVYEPDVQGTLRLQAVGNTYGGGGRPAVWSQDGAALCHVAKPVTPEDRFDRLPGRFAGESSVLVFDGRLDNRSDVLSRLNLDTGRAATMGDGGVVMAAIESWGESAFAHLIGDFALAWWDSRSRRLILACDATGGRTIYYHQDDGRICFATHPLAVLAFPGVPRRIAPQDMARAAASIPPLAGATPYQDVHRLPPAGFLIRHDGAQRLDRYWRLDPERRIRFRDDRDYELAARELLDQAVAAQSRVTGPLVCQLSGGLDSGAVVATAARLFPQTTIHALTSVPEPDAPLAPPRPDRITDEGVLAGRTAALYPNVKHHILAAGPLTPEELEPSRTFQRTGLPIRNYMNMGSWQPAFAKARDLGARAILVGNSGNATVSWEDLPFRWRWWRLLVDQVLPPALRRAWRIRKGKSPDPLLDLAALTPGWHSHVAGRNRGRAPGFSVSGERYNFNVRRQFIEDQWARRPYHAALGIAIGCEFRDPLADRRLTEFCFAIPHRQWGLGGVTRSFARRVLADRLPAEVLGFEGRGYQCPDWFHRLSGLRETIMSEIDRLEASPVARDIFDTARLRALAADWPADARAAERHKEVWQEVLDRGVYFGRFIRWVEGDNG